MQHLLHPRAPTGPSERTTKTSPCEIVLVTITETLLSIQREYGGSKASSFR